MVIDWSMIIAACTGAAIGLIGEWTGRSTSRRQEERAHLRSREDAERTRQAEKLAERERVLRDNELRAAERIVTAFQEHSVGPLKPPDTEDLTKVKALLIVIGYNHLYFRSQELRQRLYRASFVLDVLGADVPPGFDRPSLIWIIRSNVLAWLGALSRDEDLPAITQEWENLINVMHERLPALKERLRGKGVAAVEFRFNENVF
jgi:hypothetical protein